MWRWWWRRIMYGEPAAMKQSRVIQYCVLWTAILVEYYKARIPIQNYSTREIIIHKSLLKILPLRVCIDVVCESLMLCISARFALLRTWSNFSSCLAVAWNAGDGRRTVNCNESVCDRARRSVCVLFISAFIFPRSPTLSPSACYVPHRVALDATRQKFILYSH